MNEERNELNNPSGSQYDCPKCGAGGDGYAGTWTNGQPLNRQMTMVKNVESYIYLIHLEIWLVQSFSASYCLNF